MVMAVDFMRKVVRDARSRNHIQSCRLNVTVPIGQGKERSVGKERFDLIVVRSWLRERAVMSFRRFTLTCSGFLFNHCMPILLFGFS